jgi:hypothetical protein
VGVCSQKEIEHHKAFNDAKTLDFFFFDGTFMGATSQKNKQPTNCGCYVYKCTTSMTQKRKCIM